LWTKLPLKHATSNLGNRLNGKLILYLEDLANPNNGLNLVPNSVQRDNVTCNLHTDNDKIKFNPIIYDLHFE
jgi:hypothetical protein